MAARVPLGIIPILGSGIGLAFQLLDVHLPKAITGNHEMATSISRRTTGVDGQ
jgi:hypothetical protein